MPTIHHFITTTSINTSNTTNLVPIKSNYLVLILILTLIRHRADRSYVPRSVRVKYVPKYKGGFDEIFMEKLVLTFRDRVVCRHEGFYKSRIIQITLRSTTDLMAVNIIIDHVFMLISKQPLFLRTDWQSICKAHAQIDPTKQTGGTYLNIMPSRL